MKYIDFCMHDEVNWYKRYFLYNIHLLRGEGENGEIMRWLGKTKYGLVLFLLQGMLLADGTQDDNVGTWMDAFAPIPPGNGQIDVEVISSFTYDGVNDRMCGSPGGSFFIKKIEPINSDQWEMLCFDGVESGNLGLTINVWTNELQFDPTPALVNPPEVPDPDGLGRVCYDLSGLGLDGLRPGEAGIRITVTNSATSNICIEATEVTWAPITDLLIDKQFIPNPILAGQEFTTIIRFSVNKVQAQNVVVWDTLPTCADGTVTNGENDNGPFSNVVEFGQCDQPHLPDASAGTPVDSSITNHASLGADINGVQNVVPQWCDTPGGCMVGATLVPQGSVYWDFGPLAEGTTQILSFNMHAPNGTVNGTTYDNVTGINADNQETGTPFKPLLFTNQTTVLSEPAPRIDKEFRSGTFVLDGVHYANHGADVRVCIDVRNAAGRFEFGETMYCPYVFDDLSDIYVGNGADPAIHLNAGPGYHMGLKLDANLSTDPADAATHGIILEPGESYLVECLPDFSSNIVNDTGHPAILWDLTKFRPANGPTMPPGPPPPNNNLGDSVRNNLCYTFQTTTNQTVQGVLFENTATLGSARTDPVSDTIGFGLPPFPCGGFGPGGKGGPIGCVGYERPMKYRLRINNRSPFDLNNMYSFDRLPTNLVFLGANVLAGGSPNVQIFYHDSLLDDVDAPPDFDTNTFALTVGSAAWRTTPPAGVTWVVMCVSNLNSALSNGVQRAEVEINMRTPAANEFDCCERITIGRNCQRTFISNIYDSVSGLVRMDCDGNTVEGNFPIAGGKHCASTFQVCPPSPLFEFQSDCTPDTTVLPGTATVIFNVCNEEDTRINPLPDVFTNTIVTMTWSAVTINGEEILPVYAGHTVAPSGGQILNYDPGNGQMVIRLGPIAVGECRTLTARFTFPEGLQEDAEYTVAIDAVGAGTCSLCPVTGRSVVQCRVTGIPLLNLIKNDVQNLIASGDCLTYTLDARNTGSFPSHDTWVVDRMPNNMVFQSAKNPTGNDVWFSDRLPPDLPLGFSITEPFDNATIAAHFQPGIENPPGSGCWEPPPGMVSQEVTYVAWLIDDPTENKFDPGSEVILSWNVCNDDDQAGPSTNGSPPGTVIYNTTVIFSEENIQAFANQVRTTIVDLPALEFEKTGPDIVSPGEPFNWVIDYRNVGSEVIEDVIVHEFLPSGVTFLGACHTFYNIVDGQPISPTNVLVAGVDFAQTSAELTFYVSTFPDFPPGGINPLTNSTLNVGVGGRLIIKVQAPTNAVAGDMLVNRIEVDYEEFCCIPDEHPVEVQTPDLGLFKLVDNPTPLVGDVITYYVQLQNFGDGSATNVVIEDTLPPGLVYVPGPVNVSPADYTLGNAPMVTPVGGTQKVVWAGSQAISNATHGLGVVPGNSGPIYFSYQAQVVSAPLPGTTLDNYICVTNDVPEGPDYVNDDSEPVEIPNPELVIYKDGPGLVDAGGRITYEITWLNNNYAPAHDVFILEELPPNVTFVGTVEDPSVTQVWYSTTCAEFHQTNIALSLANGWTTAPPPDLADVRCLAYSIGTIPGFGAGYSILVEVEAADPVTGDSLGDGVAMTNYVDITTSDPEDNPTNRTNVVTETPGRDIAVYKRSQPEGVFPGAIPGQTITYFIVVENTGVLPACGIAVTDYWPTAVSQDLGFNDQQVVLTDAAGEEIPWQTPGGTDHPSAEATATYAAGPPVNWTVDGTFCMPPGSRFVITLSGVIDPATEDMVVIRNGVYVETPDEPYDPNNTNDTEVTVYRADVTVDKMVVDGGRSQEVIYVGDCSPLLEPRCDAPPAPAGTVAYLNFDNGDLADTSGSPNVHSGTVQSATAPNPTFSDKAICFSGNNHDNSLVRLPNHADLQNNGSGYTEKTIALWFRPDSLPGRQWITMQGDNGRGFGIYMEGGTLYAGAWRDQGNAPGERSFASVPGVGQIGEWTHVALSYEALGGVGTTTVYVNGVPTVASDNVTAAGGVIPRDDPPSIGGAFINGRRADGGNSEEDFDGCIDEYYQINRALDPDELTGFFPTNLPPTCIAITNAAITGGSETFTDQGNKLTYKIEYNNIGSADAENTVISEVVPAGTKLLPNSFSNLPSGATVSFNTPNPSNATAFTVDLGTLPAPANADGEGVADEFAGVRSNTLVYTAGFAPNVNYYGDGAIGLGLPASPCPLAIPDTVDHVHDCATSAGDFQTAGWGGANIGNAAIPARTHLFDCPGLTFTQTPGDSVTMWGHTVLANGTLIMPIGTCSTPFPCRLQLGPDGGTVDIHPDMTVIGGTWGIRIDGGFPDTAIINNCGTLRSARIDDYSASDRIRFNNHAGYAHFTRIAYDSFEANGGRFDMHITGGSVVVDTLTVRPHNRLVVDGGCLYVRTFSLGGAGQTAGTVSTIVDAAGNPIANVLVNSPLTLDVPQVIINGQNYWVFGDGDCVTDENTITNQATAANGGIGCETEGTYTTTLRATCPDFTGWDRLLVNQVIPPDASLEFSLEDSFGNELISRQPLPDGFIDISAVPLSVTELSVTAYFEAPASDPDFCVSPILEQLVATYECDSRPFFTFCVEVCDPIPHGILSIDNTVRITTDTPEKRTDNNEAEDSIFVRSADLRMTKSASAAAVLPGETITYSLRVENLGPQPATNIVITEHFPESLLENPQICATNINGGATITTHAAGDTQVPAHSSGGGISAVNLIGTTGQLMDMTISRGSQGNQTYAAADLIGVNLTAFAGSGSTALLSFNNTVPPVGMRDTFIEDNNFYTGVINPSSASMAMQLNFLAPVCNSHGPDLVIFEGDNSQSGADDIEVHIPGGSPASITYGIDDFIVGPNNRSLRSLQISSPPAATLTELQNDAFSGNSGAGNFEPYGVAIDLDDFGIPPGACITSIALNDTGQGPDPVFIAGLPGILPPPTAVQELNWLADVLYPGETIEIVLKGTVRQGTSSNVVNNVAEVHADRADDDWDNNIDTAQTKIGDLANMAVEKFINGNPLKDFAVANEPFAWTICYTNNGNAVASNAMLIDTLPPHVDLLMPIPGNPLVVGDSITGFTLTWMLGDLPAQAGGCFDVTGNVSEAGVLAASGNPLACFTNRATVSTDTQEFPNDNEDTAVIDVAIEPSTIAGVLQYNETMQLADRPEDIAATNNLTNVVTALPPPGYAAAFPFEAQIRIQGTDLFGNPIDLTVPAVNGEWSFPGLYAHDPATCGYTVTITPAPGYEFLIPGTQIPGPNNGLVTENTIECVQLASATVEDNYVHFVRGFSAVSGVAWFDSNTNGTREATEPRLAGVPVTLYENCGQPGESIFGVTTTDVNGVYGFTNVVLGTDYCVEWDLAALINTETNVTSQDAGPDDVDSDSSQADPYRADPVFINTCKAEAFDVGIAALQVVVSDEKDLVIECLGASSPIMDCEAVTWTWTLENTSTVGQVYNAADISLDAQLCSDTVIVTGDDGDNLLEPGETWIYTCTFYPPASALCDGLELTNIANFVIDGSNCPPTTCTVAVAADPNAFSGCLYLDNDCDGTYDCAESVYTNGATLTAYDCDNQPIATAQVSPAGCFSFPFLPREDLRLELTGLADGFTPTFVGPDSPMDTSFLTGTNRCDYKIGIFDKREPTVCVDGVIAGVCYTEDPNVDTLVLSSYNTQGLYAAVSPGFTTLGTLAQTGPLLGLAYHENSDQLFAGATIKNAAGTYPAGQGPGSIYVSDLVGGITPFFDVATLAPTHPTPLPTTVCEQNDYNMENAFAAGLGDLEIVGDTLYTINLFDQTLVEIPITPLGIAPPPASVNTYPIPDPGCASLMGRWRPAALGQRDGLLYVGGVCSGELGPNNPSNLHAYVYTFDPATGSFSPNPVADHRLDYTSSASTPEQGLQCRQWNVWNFSPATADVEIGAGGATRFACHKQPVLSDIEFDRNGQMSLGFADRFAFQVNNQDRNFTPGTGCTTRIGPNRIRIVSSGDILRFFANPDGTFTAEENGNSGCFITSGGVAADPGINEFYDDDFIFENVTDVSLRGHGEVTLGYLSYLSDADTLASTSFDPVNGGPGGSVLETQGVRFFDIEDGSLTRAFQYVPYSPQANGKGAGVGDIEAWCTATEPKKFEIGNRVWFDCDKNGIQDPCDAVPDGLSLSNITVQLWSNSTLLASTTTDVNGAWFFNSTNTPGLVTGASLKAVIPLTGALTGFTPTTVDYAGNALNTDAHDSDAIYTNINGTPVAAICFTAPAEPGCNDYSLDIGLYFGGTPIFTCPDVGPTDLGCVYNTNVVPLLMGEPSVELPPCGDFVLTSSQTQVLTGCTYTVCRIITVSNACPIDPSIAVAACTQKFTFTMDLEPPKIVRVNQGRDLGCIPDGTDSVDFMAAYAPLAADLGSLVATDQCSECTLDISLWCDTYTTNGCIISLERKIRVSDCCGNVAIASILYTTGHRRPRNRLSGNGWLPGLSACRIRSPHESDALRAGRNPAPAERLLHGRHGSGVYRDCQQGSHRLLPGPFWMLYGQRRHWTQCHGDDFQFHHPSIGLPGNRPRLCDTRRDLPRFHSL